MKLNAGLSIVLLFTALLTPAALLAQFQKITNLSHPEVVHAAVDRPGELYLIFRDSSITRYDTDGKVAQQGNMPFMPEIFDPHDGARLFAFDRHSGHYLYFTPSFTFAQSPTPPDSAFAIDPVFACSAGDRDMIILDAADRSIKKVDLKGHRVLFESIVSDSVADFSSLKLIREYQNFVFMLDPEKGILIFNMLGRLLRTIPGNDISYFNFLGEELYYPDGKSLRFFNLFTTESRVMELPYQARFALLTDERLYLVNPRKTEVFSLKP